MGKGSQDRPRQDWTGRARQVKTGQNRTKQAKSGQEKACHFEPSCRPKSCNKKFWSALLSTSCSSACAYANGGGGISGTCFEDGKLGDDVSAFSVLSASDIVGAVPVCLPCRRRLFGAGGAVTGGSSQLGSAFISLVLVFRVSAFCRLAILLTMSFAFLTRVISSSLVSVGVARFVYLFSGKDVVTVGACASFSAGLSQVCSRGLSTGSVDTVSGGLSKRLLFGLPGASLSH